MQALLAGVDTSVPHRGDKEDKRITAHVERWSICKFLATYGHTRFARYPLLVEKRERSDYRMSSRDLVVGIEITAAVSEDMARIDAMRFDETWPLVYDNSSLPMLNVARAAELLLPKLAPFRKQPVFEQLFVEYGKQFVRFSPDGFETRFLNDLWH